MVRIIQNECPLEDTRLLKYSINLLNSLSLLPLSTITKLNGPSALFSADLNILIIISEVFQFNATTEITELYAKDFASYSKHEGGTFFTCGVVNGHYKDNEDDVELKGTYSLDQTRWLSKYIKHKSLDVDLLLPPNGLGFTIKRVSHRLLGLEGLLKIQLRPKLEFIFNFRSASKT